MIINSKITTGLLSQLNFNHIMTPNYLFHYPKIESISFVKRCSLFPGRYSVNLPLPRFFVFFLPIPNTRFIERDDEEKYGTPY